MDDSRGARARREHDADTQALVSDDAAITYAELDDASRELAQRLVAAGVGKAARVGLLMPNGIEWATTALAIMRVGGVLVPLSTLLRPPELSAQLRTAAVTHLVVVRAYRDRAYLDDLEQIAPGITDLTRPRRRHPAIPSLRHVSVAGELTAPAAPDRSGRRDGSRGAAGRRPRDHVHVGKPRRAQGRDPHARQRAPGNAAPGSRIAASGAASGSTSRCRSSGWVGSAAAC